MPVKKTKKSKSKPKKKKTKKMGACQCSRPKKKKTQTGKGMYDKTVNKLTGSKLRDGEKHPIMYVDGKFKPGEFLGPGSHVLSKVKEGKKRGISPVDSVAYRHDLAYSLSKNKKDVRDADLHMLKVLDAIQKDKKDSKFNIYQGKVGIKSKIFLEDKLGVKPERFTSFGDEGYTKKEKDMMQKQMDELTQAGYGKGAKKKKNPWLTHVAKYRKEHPKLSYKECLKHAKTTYKK